MKLVKTNSKYIYEIESEYKIGDRVKFTPGCKKFIDQTGTIVAIIASEGEAQYFVKYYYKIFGGYSKVCLAQMDPQTEMFNNDEIELNI